MLDAWIIEEIKKKEEEKRRKEDQDRPRIDIPPSTPPIPEKKPETEETPDRGIIIINPDGTESTR